MSRILLLSPPYINLYGKFDNAAGRYFPLGLGYIAAYLQTYGHHTVTMYEPEAQKLNRGDMEQIISGTNPDVVAITCATPNFPRAVELAHIVKTCTDAKVVIGGVHASALPEFIMKRYADVIDCVVVGEGETTMLELVDAYMSGKKLDDVLGIVFCKNGSIVRTAKRPLITELDTLPFPARDLIPQHLFRPNLHNARYKNCLTLLTSRGCPYNCSFCAARIVSGTKYRTHSSEYVLEEMSHLKRDYQAEQLIITDDTFTIDHERLERICRGMIDKRLKLSWFCFSQVNTVNRDIMKMMMKAGCYSIGFGVESADESLLLQMGKPISPTQAKNTIRTANELGLKTQAFYIFGLPGETKAKMQATVRFAEEVNSTLAFFNMLVPYPGTRDFDTYFNGVQLDDIIWEDFVAIGENCVLRNSTTTASEIEQVTLWANRRYYAHPKRLFNILRHIGTRHELLNHIKGGYGLMKQMIASALGN